MDFKISGAFFHMSEPDGAVICMEQGMEAYIVLRFYEPMVITVGQDTVVTERDACIIYAPQTPRRYCAVRGGFFNDYFSFLADAAFVEKYNMPINQVFYLSEPEKLSSHIGFIAWALTDVLYDHEALIRQQTDGALSYIQSNIRNIQTMKMGGNLMHEDYVALRNEIQSDPAVWTVEKMAVKMHLSRSHFSVNYKKIFGISPGAELSYFLVERAKYLLRETDERVSVIADKCGYINTENFIRAFKKTIGVTPLAFRKMGAKDI